MNVAEYTANTVHTTIIIFVMIVLCMTVEQEPETRTRIGGDGF